MSIISYLNGLFHPKPKPRYNPTVKKTQTTQEAAARALDQIFSSNRKGTRS